DERFRLLRGGGHAERHQTLQSTIDWSYSMLDDVQQRVFDRLSVFPATFDTEAAASVCGDEEIDDVDVLDALGRLVDHSMVSAEPSRDGSMRYELLETIRQYALVRLGDDVERCRRRHAEHFAGIAREANTGLTGRDEVRWRKKIDVEVEN